jgi:uncharacterized protein (DUF1800 family)
MSLANQQKNQHLLWRAGFGPAADQLHDLQDISPQQLYKVLERASDKSRGSIVVADNYLVNLLMGSNGPGKLQRKELSIEERKMFLQKNREGIKNLNLSWLKEMVNSGAQLREKMAFFWHGHFACRNLNVYFQQCLLDVIRQNALGNFGTLLKEVSKTPAMLNFLNNQQNRKGHPNENFAREVMELFTLGRGNYTEQDVKEAARSFTGWGFNAAGEFMFRRGQHDYDSKTFLDKKGNFDGDDILNILLEQKQTAFFISQKIYKFFVNDQPDKNKVEWLANRFYKSNYDISSLMEDVFTSDWFYNENNIGAKIKSPVELLVGIQRMLPMTIENNESLIIMERLLDQVLFFPPNVAGWPGGKSWIDSSTLMLRMRIPQLINDKDELKLKPKDDDDQMMGRKEEDPPVASIKMNMKGMKKGAINADVDWKIFTSNFDKIVREKLINTLSGVLLQTNKGVSDEIIKEYTDETNRENFIKTATIQIMSTPEYQLC